jgi:hypothetical protein
MTLSGERPLPRSFQTDPKEFCMMHALFFKSKVPVVVINGFIWHMILFGNAGGTSRFSRRHPVARRGMRNAERGRCPAENDPVATNRYFIPGFPEASIEFMQSFTCFHAFGFFKDYLCT